MTESRAMRVKKKRVKNGGGGCVENRGQQKRDIVVDWGRGYAVPELYGQ